MSKKGAKAGNQRNSSKDKVSTKVDNGKDNHNIGPKPLTIIEELLLMIDGDSPVSDIISSKQGTSKRNSFHESHSIFTIRCCCML